MVCLISLFEPQEIAYLYTSISPVYCSYIWLLPGTPTTRPAGKMQGNKVG